MVVRAYVLNNIERNSINEVIKSFGLEKEKYNWIFTDVNGDDKEKIFDGNINILNNEELDCLLENYELRFSYVVITGVLQNEVIELNKDSLPYSNGNIDLWGLNPKFQHSQSKVELVVFDDKYIIVQSNNYKLLSNFKSKFSEVQSLRKINNSLWKGKNYI